MLVCFLVQVSLCLRTYDCLIFILVVTILIDILVINLVLKMFKNLGHAASASLMKDV
jgi:hypothetical protein